MCKSRKRVQDILDGKIPDRVPCLELSISQNVIDKLYENIDYYEFVIKEDIDFIFVKQNFHNKWLDRKEGLYINEWGIIKKVSLEDSDDYIDGPVKTINDLKKLKIPNPEDDFIYTDLKNAVKKYKKNKIICFLSKASFNFPWYLMGNFQKYLMEYYLNPKLIEGLHKISEEYHLEINKKALKIGADIIVVTDDYAYGDKMFIPREKFKKYCLKTIEKTAELVHKKDGRLFLHSDGNIQEILDLIIDAGIDFLHPLESGGLDILKVYNKYKDRVIICGNLDCSHTLTFGTKEMVKKQVLWLLENIAPEGRYILSSSNCIHSKVKPENFKVMLETVKKYGRYPINF